MSEEAWRLTVTEACRRLATEHGVIVSPHELSTLLYRRVLGPELAPMIGGRRMIHPRDLTLIAAAIRGRKPVKPAGKAKQAG